VEGREASSSGWIPSLGRALARFTLCAYSK
jgi:hypothetical protein